MKWIVIAWNKELERFETFSAGSRKEAFAQADDLSPKKYETPIIERADDFEKHPSWYDENPAVKGNPMATAKQIAARKLFAQRVKAGDFAAKKPRRKNPLTRVKVNSPSMATKEAPSKRLKARRRKTDKAPPGVYANPARRYPDPVIPAPNDSEPLNSIFSYYVQWFNSVSGLWRSVAAFANETDAFQYARAWAKTSRGASKTIRVATPDR